MVVWKHKPNTPLWTRFLPELLTDSRGVQYYKKSNGIANEQIFTYHAISKTHNIHFVCICIYHNWIEKYSCKIFISECGFGWNTKWIVTFFFVGLYPIIWICHFYSYKTNYYSKNLEFSTKLYERAKI